MIFHIARRADWDAAVEIGEYHRSTLDRTLDEEGFIHASEWSQLAGVADRYYRDVPDELVLLVIDTGRLDVELRYETPPGGTEAYPHIYGPLSVASVAEVRPLARRPDGSLSGW